MWPSSRHRHQPRDYNETARSGPYVVERIASHQREDRLVTRIQDRCLRRIDYLGGFHLINGGSICPFQFHPVAGAKGAQVTKVEVPMARDDAILGLPRKRRSDKMPRRS